MLKQLVPAFRLTLAFTVLTGFIYPGVVTGLCQLLFHQQANGSLIVKDGRVIGSGLVGQNFTKPEYFHSRPSAAGNDGYDASASSGSNLGPTSKKLIERVKADIEKFRRENPDYQGEIPSDLVTASGSGLDPHISLASAQAQAARVAKARGVTEEQVNQLVAKFTEHPTLTLLGDPRVNVMQLNLALDRELPKKQRIADRGLRIGDYGLRIKMLLMNASMVAGSLRTAGNPQSSIRNPQSAIHNPQSAIGTRQPGRLKVFLGYASGVGKSFRMLDEARRRNERGREDVVVAAVQPRVPPEVEPILVRLEQIPTLQLDGKQVLDLPAILRRHPGVCVIDGLAYDNPPGAPHRSRYEDIEELLEAGINVLTSVNLQYIKELRDEVQTITGKRVSETVPVAFINAADEIELVDAPPEASDPRLSQLREMALVLAADVVDHELEQYLVRHGLAPGWGPHERILVCLTPKSNAHAILAAGSRIADRFHADLFAVYVRQPENVPQDEAVVEHHLEAARGVGAQVEILDGEDPVDTILDFARSHGITQIFIGHSRRTGWWSRWTSGPVDRLLDEATDMDVRVFPQ